MSVSTTKRKPFAYSDRDHCLAAHGNIVVSFSLQPPNPHFLDAWTAAVQRLALNGPISVLIVIDSQSRAPDDKAKQTIRDTVSKHGDHISTFAYVVEGQGFGAAAMRSALSLIGLIARYPFPQKVFANISDASTWMGQRAPESAVPSEVLSLLVDGMRDQVKRLAATA